MIPLICNVSNRQIDKQRLPHGSVVKNLPANAGDTGDTNSIPGLGRRPRGENSNPLLYSYLEDSMDRQTQQAAVHGITKKSDMTEHSKTEMRVGSW